MNLGLSRLKEKFKNQNSEVGVQDDPYDFDADEADFAARMRAKAFETF